MVKELSKAIDALNATGDPKDQAFVKIVAGVLEARGGDIEVASRDEILGRLQEIAAEFGKQCTVSGFRLHRHLQDMTDW